MNVTPKFSSKSIDFLIKAGRQKHPEWLDKNRADYEDLLLLPLQNLARQLKIKLGPLAPGYNFPQKGIGRLKRPAHWVAESGGGCFKSWLSYTAARPPTSRFERNPSIFFLINTEDSEDPVLLAGGLYMPSSRQTRALREAIAQDASAFDKLFASKAFKSSFSAGFSDERKSSRPARGFDPNHPQMDWLRLQAFFVWRAYSRKQFTSADFAKTVARDAQQILRLNELLDLAVSGRLRVTTVKKEPKNGLLDHLDKVESFARKMDF